MSNLSLYDREEQTIGRLVEEWRGKPCNVKKLAESNNVPYQRLNNRLHDKTRSTTAYNASQRVLSVAQETALVEYIDFLDVKGTKARVKEIEIAANRMLRNAGVNRTVSKHFTPRFLKEHPDFLVRKEKPLVVERKNAQNIPAIAGTFRLFKATIAKYKILPDDIANMDETGFRIGMGGDQYIVTRERHRKLTIRDPDNRESLTSIETIRGDGTVLPPYIVLNGKQYMEKWFEATDLEEEATFDLSDTGYSNDEISLRYLEHFNRNCPPKGVYRMLVMDGHGSHNHQEFAARCEELKIIPFFLYPHTTHICQPLDVACFQPLKHYHRQAIDEAVRFDEEAVYTKTDFLATFQRIRMLTFTFSTIKSAFKRTGLIPYFPSIVIDIIKAEIVAQKKLQQLATQTPKLSKEEQLQRTPKGLTADLFLKEFAVFDSYINQRLSTDPGLVNVRRAFEKLSKGVTAKIHAGALLESKIASQTAAVTARKERNSNNRRINHSGPLTVGTARVKSQSRKATDKLQDEAAQQRKKNQDFKAWCSDISRVAFLSKPLTRYYIDPKTGNAGRGYVLNQKSLQQWRLVIEQLGAPHIKQLQAEADARAEAQWASQTAIIPLYSSSPARSGYASSEEEAFGFMPVGYRRRRASELQEELAEAQAAMCM